MAKIKTVYACTECGGQSLKWQGQCPHCSAWNTLVESTTEPKAGGHRFASLAGSSEVVTLADVEAKDFPRLPTMIGEFDRVLGGGLVEGGVVLIGGDPGIGKSTLLLQAAARLSAQVPVLYVSGEESAQQIALRARRLGLDASAVKLLPEIELEKIQATLASMKPRVAVIDSIQTLYSSALTSAPGSVAQVRECAAQITRLAKQTGITVVFVGHVTKEGALAGPRVLEHMVDTVLYFEGDTHTTFRLVRAVKNRFGAVNELGVFAMTEKGLREVTNPSALFLSQHATDVAGSCVMVTQEGTRPLLVELQALVDDSHGMSPKRLTVGLELNRLAMLLAVLHRHAGIACFDQDVFVNAVGGVRIAEPGADLAVTLAIVSSLRSKPLPGKHVVFGEVGLAGEVRPVQRGQERLKEAAKLGFTHAIVPAANKPRQPIAGLEVIAVERLSEAVDYVRK
ncbi:DNA repair protein RadA [Usitatibacter palustris]|uniref:DNA repair protein RadA n=1 Tax=Usitatibacter palustris TaxID=2732487 RepID=A0A6M4H7W3_9PROT|nr:DNA repair protein RadA [Usitatibacter palustris]QJR15660.1 DNA repair protein RadA [Usitatibacter palustris]